MKKAFVFFTILSATLAFSQEFILTEDNYKLKDDNSKNYTVLDFPGKNKEELFILTKKYISSNYRSVENEEYKEVVNEQIISDITSLTSRTIFISKKGPNIWRVVNSYEINFKDFKIMIRPTFLHLVNTDNNTKTTIGSFYDSRGILRLQNATYFVDAFTNTFVRNLKKEILDGKTSDW